MTILSRLSDYLTLTKPRLVSLVLVTTAVGFIVGSGASVSVTGFLHVLIGTALVAGGGAALNQYLERHADTRMARTASRPIPSMRVGEGEGLLVGSAITLTGLLYLLVFTNPLTFIVGFTCVAFYVFAYTLLKPITPWCVAIGAVVGALPPVMGWTAASNSVGLGAVILFIIMFVWQLPHFLAIAWLYRDEYANARMSVVQLTDVSGVRTTRHILWLNLLLIPLTLLPALVGMAKPTYTIIATLLGIGFAIVALRRDSSDMASYARRIFHTSLIYLPILFIILAIFRRN